MAGDKSALFSDVPVRKAVLTLAIPPVISQLITVVYNMADTFFIGQLNDPLQVAAAILAMPCFMFLTAFANLFGLGGSSLLSRCLGSGEPEKARHTAAFCIWTGITVFQTIGKKVQPLFLSLLRKGSLDIVFMLLLNGRMGVSGIAGATPFADWIAFVISMALVVPCLRRLNMPQESTSF